MQISLTSVSFWAHISIFLIRYSYVVSIFFVISLFNRFTNKTITFLEWLATSSFLCTILAAFFSLLLYQRKKTTYLKNFKLQLYSIIITATFFFLAILYLDAFLLRV